MEQRNKKPVGGERAIEKKKSVYDNMLGLKCAIKTRKPLAEHTALCTPGLTSVNNKAVKMPRTPRKQATQNTRCNNTRRC